MPDKKIHSPRKQKAKAKNSWFKTQNKYVRCGPLVVSLVAISKSLGLSEKDSLKRQKRRSLVVSVPKACGSAVQRNRFRRIMRAQLKTVVETKLSENKGLWIRLLNTHRLPRAISWQDWKALLTEALNRLQIVDLDPES